MYTAKTLIQSSVFKPTQWDGITIDNKIFYIKYSFYNICLYVDKIGKFGNSLELLNNKNTENVDFICVNLKNEKNISLKNISLKKVKKVLKPYIDLSKAKVQLNEVNWDY